MSTDKDPAEVVAQAVAEAAAHMADELDNLMEIEDYILLSDEDGNEIEHILLEVMEVDGVEYALLAPVESAEYEDGDDGDDVELLICTYAEDEEKGEEHFGPIEDDATYEKVREAFARFMEHADEEEEEGE